MAIVDLDQPHVPEKDGNLELPLPPNLLSDLMEISPEVAAKIQDLMGGSENFNDYINNRNRVTLVSTEDFKESLNKLIEYILLFIQNIMKDIENGSIGSSIVLDDLEERIDELLVKTRSSSSRFKEPTFKVDTRIANLSIRYKPITDIQTLIAGIKTMGMVAKAYYSYQNETLINTNIPADLVMALKDPQLQENLINSIAANSPTHFASKSTLFFDHGLSYTSLHLLGNKQLSIIDRRPNDDLMTRSINTTVELKHSEIDPLEVPTEIQFNHFSSATQLTVLRGLKSLVQYLESQNTLNIRSRRNNKINAIRTTISKVKADLDNNTNEKSDEELRELILLLDAYLQWLINPFIGFMALCCRNIKAALNVCDRNI